MSAIIRYTSRQRFNFLASLTEARHLRYALCCPDLHEPRWTIYDKADRITIGFGASAAEAVDHAIQRTNFHVTKIKTASTAQ